MPRAEGQSKPVADVYMALYSPEAEGAVVAGCMLWDVLEHIEGLVEPADFFLERMRDAYAAILRIDGVTYAPMVAYQMEQDGTLDLHGGEPWLVTVTGYFILDMAAITAGGIRASARIVASYAERRRQLEEAVELADSAIAGGAGGRRSSLDQRYTNEL